MIGKGPEQVLPPDDAASVLAHYRTCVKRRLPTTFQEVLHLPTGRRHWETRLVPIIGGASGSRVTRLFGSSIDISERVEAEQALRDSEQRFRSIFEHAGVGIGYAAVDGRIIDVNRTLESMLGYCREEVIGQSFKQFVHEDEISQVTGRFQELLSGRKATFQTERRFQRRDGTELWARTTASLVRDPAWPPQIHHRPVRGRDRSPQGAGAYPLSGFVRSSHGPAEPLPVRGAGYCGAGAACPR